MANKKNQHIIEFSDSDLQERLTSAVEEYHKMEFDHAIRGLENPLTIREKRREIARMKTELRNREIKQMDEAQLAARSKKRNRR